MNNILQFVKNFNANKGGFVFASFVIEKLIGLFNTIYLVRLIAKEDFGLITLISSLFAIAITLNGLGSVQGLLRYGSMEESEEEKNKLAQYIFKTGLKKHILLTIGFTIIALFYEIKFIGIWMIVLWFTIRFIGYYFYFFILTYYRIHHQNNRYGSISIFVNCVGSILTFLLTWKLNTLGYLFGLAFTPWLSLLFFKSIIFQKSILNLKTINLKEFWSYSLQSAINYGLAEVMIMLDVLFIGLFLSETDVANYKIAIILPMNLIFLAAVIIQTDFPKIVTHANDKNYLSQYIKNYHQIFIPLGIVISLIGFFIKDWVVTFVFGPEYGQVGWLFFIILIAVVFNMCFRNLFSNLLSAVGLAKENTKVALTSIGTMIILSVILIPLFGILGAAIALSLTFITMGIWSGYLFKKYLQSL